MEKNRLAHAIRHPLTAKDIDDVVLVDEANAARLLSPTAPASEYAEGRSNLERIAQFGGKS